MGGTWCCYYITVIYTWAVHGAVIILLSYTRVYVGLEPTPEYMLEQMMESLEMTCYDNMQNTKKNTIGLGVEFDENSVCNVCQSVSNCICQFL